MTARGFIVHRPGGEACSNQDIAMALGLHPRTLHRSLQREGTTFQRVKDGVGADFLAHYLRHSSLPLAEISCRLGFSEQSAMPRFCQQWFGSSPRFRRRDALQ